MHVFFTEYVPPPPPPPERPPFAYATFLLGAVIGTVLCFGVPELLRSGQDKPAPPGAQFAPPAPMLQGVSNPPPEATKE